MLNKNVVEFVELCKKTQNELLKYLPKVLLNFYKKKRINATKDYIFVKGDIPVLLVAHLDTVHKKTVANVWIDYTQNIIKSDEGIGGDDRCGVYAILNILKKSTQRPFILFTTNEEIGGVGVAKFCKDYAKKGLDVNCMIEIDRRGHNDVVRYDDDNDSLIDIFTKDLDYKESQGSYTDICTLAEEFGVSGVNLSSGYYNAHTLQEYVVLSDLEHTIDRVIIFIQNPAYWSKKHVFESVPYDYNGFGYNSWWYDRYADQHKQQKNNKRRYFSSILQCECCGEAFYEEDMIYLADIGYVCEDCYNLYKEFYVECKHCGELVPKDDGICDYCGAIIEQEENEEEPFYLTTKENTQYEKEC